MPQCANMLSVGQTLIETVALHARNMNGQDIDGYLTFVLVEPTSLVVQYRGQRVLTISDYNARVGAPGRVDTSYKATFTTYVGWKLYMRLTGCFASRPDGDKLLAQGIDAPIETLK